MSRKIPPLAVLLVFSLVTISSLAVMGILQSTERVSTSGVIVEPALFDIVSPTPIPTPPSAGGGGGGGTPPPTDPTPVPPEADANGPYAGIEGQSVSFSSIGSSDSDGTIVSYNWDFGDGGTSSSRHPSHIYSAEGTYVVKLTVTDDEGLTDRDTAPCTVSASEPELTYEIELFSDPECTTPLIAVEWGALEAGGSTSSNIYVKNTGTGEVQLILESSNWAPPGADNYLSLSWDYDGSLITPGDIKQVVLILSVSPDCPPYDYFDFDIIINTI